MVWAATDIMASGVAKAARCGVVAAAMLMLLMPAFAQQPPQHQPQQPSPARPEEPGVLESLGRWLDKQGENISSSFKDTGKGVENFGREAGTAAQTTLEGARDAAGAVVRIPAARMVSGNEKCRIAPNGAPDCIAAATAMCKARGFQSGSSADMTTAEVCPAQVYLQGRNSGPECRTETFVSRALCQ